MADVIVIGGGPAGLAIISFAAKDGLFTTVFDTDQTWMRKVHLLNYPGIGSTNGSNCMKALRTQVDHSNTERYQGEEVTDVSESDNEFVVTTDDNEYGADYAVFATGVNRDLTKFLGCAFDDDLVDVDVTMGTSVEDAYVTNTMVRTEEWQAAISAGSSAVVALNILLKEEDERYHDFGVPADVESVFGSLIDEV